VWTKGAGGHQGNALFQNVEALLFSAEFGMRNAKKCKRVDDQCLCHSEIHIPKSAFAKGSSLF
jgi:hypothetical protein